MTINNQQLAAGGYSAIGADGRMYGPVDEQTLASWAREGRIGPATQVSIAATGQIIPAASLFFLSPIFQPYPAAYGAPTNGLPSYGISYAGPMSAPASHAFTEFSTVGAVLLHFVTCGLFSMIYLNLMHDKMPKVRHDDPSAGKAIGFLFIPFFNLYWMFFTYSRLCMRINEQRRLHGLAESAPQGLAVAMCILMVIPYVNMIGFGIMMPIFVGMVQSSVNELASVRM